MSALLIASHAVPIFATPYDPLDLASDSLDPLGFTRGYVALADHILPGFTTITTAPRYPSMLCAAISAAIDAVPTLSSAAATRAARIAAIKSYERAWAVACTLARDDVGEPAVLGLRGIRSAERALATAKGGSLRTRDFDLLANQVRYGGIGAYATFIEASLLGSLTTCELTDLGAELAQAFPAPDLRVHDEDARLPLDALRTWGQRCHLGTITGGEARILREALRGGDYPEPADRVRWTTLRLLAAIPPAPSEAPILETLGRRIDDGEFEEGFEDCAAQIHDALEVIAPYESLYQAALFLFDALRAEVTDRTEVRISEIAGAADLADAHTAAARHAARMRKVLEPRSGKDHARITDAVSAIRQARIPDLATDLIEAPTPAHALEVVVRRHRSVQDGKLEGGRPKAPWLTLDGGVARLTAQRNGLARHEGARSWKHVARHPYRTAAAYRFVDMCKVPP